jgi:ABC-type transport system substrate-binding protein
VGRRITAIAATALALLFVGAPAFAAGMRGTAADTHPLRVTVGTLGAIGSLDPRHGNSAVANEVWNLQYPTLTALDPKTLDPTTGVSSGWSPAKGGHGWVYTVRKGLVWSDGRPVTADDVVYSLEHARDEHWPYAATMVAGLKARSLDDRTVEVTSTTKNAPPGFLLHVVPAHVFSTSPDIGSDASKLGVADGIWHVASTTHDSVELDAVHPESGPAVQQIVFHAYPNPDALINALTHKDVDVVSGVPAADVGRLEALSGVTVNHATDGTKYTLRFNSFPVGFLNAASRAIDRTALVADAVHGVGTPAPIEAAPGAARAELAPLEADGNSEPTIAIPDDRTGRHVADLVRADLAAAGLKTRVYEAGADGPRPNLSIERVAIGDATPNSVALFEPDTLQAFRSDNVTGWLPDPQLRRLVVFGPTVAQYGQLAAARTPLGERASNSVYVFGAVIVLALCAALYWIVSRIRRHYVPTEETDVSS